MCVSMNELTNLLLILEKIPITNKTLGLAVALVIGLIIYKVIDDKKQLRYYNDMKAEKNKEIECLADDNRRYRDIYLKGLGISQEQVNEMSAANMKGG